MQLLQNEAYAKHFSKVEGILTNGIIQGKSTQEITDEILKVTDMDARRARFWAEDQASIFFAEQTRIAALRAGYTHYRWRKGGANSRPSHAVHDGKIFSCNVGVNNLTRPGARHPGEDYRCHCTAELLTAEQVQKLNLPKEPPSKPQTTKELIENYFGSEEFKVEKGAVEEKLSSFFGNLFGKKSNFVKLPKAEKRGIVFLASCENILRSVKDSEIAFIQIDRQVVKFTGDLNSVIIPSSVNLSGSIALHNHLNGGSFSLDDFLFLVKNNVSEMRAVSEDRVFVLSLNKKFTIDEIVKLRKRAEKLHLEFLKKVDLYLLEGMSYYDAHLKASHEFAKQLANEFGLKYQGYEY